MEAGVLLKPQIMLEVDYNSNTLNAELEVKKLQELVRKLEKQNEQLRTRANGSPKTLCSAPACILPSDANYRFTNPLSTPVCPSFLGSLFPRDEQIEYFHPHSGGGGSPEWEDGESVVSDELDVLDLDSVFSSGESDETWLYVSPRASLCGDSPLTALQWCRHVLDSPASEVEAARRSLSLRLEQVSRWRQSLSTPSSFSTSPATPSRVAGVSPLSSSLPTLTCSTPQWAERHALSFSSPPPHPAPQRPSTPRGTEHPPVTERTPMFVPHLASRSRSLGRLTFSQQSSVESESEDDSISLGFKLQDLMDVQVMARLQEESLRQHYASSTTSLLATRRSRSASCQLSALSLGPAPGLQEEDEEEEDYGLLPPPQPRLARVPRSFTFSSARDWRKSTGSLAVAATATPPTTPTTPPYPSAGFPFQPQPLGLGLGLGLGLPGAYAPEQQGFRPGSESVGNPAKYENKLRRSMPNLVRAPSMPSVPVPANPSASLSLLRNSQSFDSSSTLARLQSSIPSPGQLQSRVHSLGNFGSSRQPPKATAYVSPTVKGPPPPAPLPQAPSGIPQPSKAPASAPGTPHRALPRPISFAAGSTPRSKIAQSARSLLTPPKSMSALTTLPDAHWRDGCY